MTKHFVELRGVRSETLRGWSLILIRCCSITLIISQMVATRIDLSIGILGLEVSCSFGYAGDWHY